MRKIYRKPVSVSIDIRVAQIIAASGDAGGTVNPMPWGSNKRDGYDAEEWNESCLEDEKEYWN